MAEEFLKAAKNNLKTSLRTAANRLYFALERAVIAYLKKKNVKAPKNHQQLWNLTAENLGEEYYQGLRKAYDLRMQADYGVISIFTELTTESIERNLMITEILIGKIKKTIG